MSDFRSLHVFVRAVELGSLSAAARELHTTQSNASKIVAALEDGLRVRLLERSTASLALTVPGRRFYARAKGLLEEYAEAVADARGETAAAAGLLRVNAPVALGQFALNGIVQDFLRAYPGMEVELILNDRMADLVEDGVDVALRLGGSLPPNAVARKVAVSPRWLVASPAYLKANPAPAHPEELSHHSYIRFAWLASGDRITLHAAGASLTVQTHGRFRVNNALAIRDSLLAGAGIGLCPAWLVQDLVAARKLRRVLKEWHGDPQEIHLLYPTRRYQPARARLFMEFIQPRLAQLPGMSAE
ncbi:LysR family transcriptional regulator [Massilia endophytica]|uniref:LysR family transcriptional regulator n=1 Tax=Massilia endophytica TaxID=2899220 RepID=UPI001E2C151B|nr:LysR family transcriptional regulator [Massilia endophytica]UGQ47118.1 LysR family transcriptional regulator [Massilia endophytica]